MNAHLQPVSRGPINSSLKELGGLMERFQGGGDV
jgi:hypothetical protein